MSWINKYLSEQDFKNIEAAISAVEEQTQGEIVPVIVRRSSAIGHIPLSLTLVFILLLLVLELPWKDWLWVHPWIYLWPVLIFFCFLLSNLLARFKWIQKVFVPEHDEMDQVHQRAHLEFFVNQVHRTQAGTGVLIFVSVMEKKAVILADPSLAAKLPKDAFDPILQKFMQGLKKGQWGTAFVEAIQDCGEPLKTHFPIKSESARELKNHLIVK